MSLNADFDRWLFQLQSLRLLSRCSNTLTRSDTLRQAGEDRLRSSRAMTSTGLKSSARSDTLLQAGDFIKLCPELSTKVPDSVRPLENIFRVRASEPANVT